MRVFAKDVDPGVLISNLSAGVAFEYRSGYFMKLKFDNDEIGLDINRVYAVRLVDGDLIPFDKGTRVVTLDGEVRFK